jgi:hypothetical protein
VAPRMGQFGQEQPVGEFAVIAGADPQSAAAKADRRPEIVPPRGPNLRSPGPAHPLAELEGGPRPWRRTNH